MTLQQQLANSKDAVGKTGMIGTQSDWQLLSQFTLRGNHLQMVEKRIIGDTGPETVIISASPGMYLVECRIMTFDSDKRISRMRIRRDNTDPKLGETLGEISVDLGGIAIADIDVLAPSIQENEEDYREWIETSLYDSSDFVGVLHWSLSKTHVPFADGGFGDGVYRVYKLLDNGETVGMEVEFIPEKTPYPFGGS